jgi:hypothetical protein
VRYPAFVTFVAVMNILFGVMLVGIDIHAGMPTFWILSEGPPIIAFGAVVGLLKRAAGPVGSERSLTSV